MGPADAAELEESGFTSLLLCAGCAAAVAIAAGAVGAAGVADAAALEESGFTSLLLCAGSAAGAAGAGDVAFLAGAGCAVAVAAAFAIALGGALLGGALLGGASVLLPAADSGPTYTSASGMGKSEAAVAADAFGGALMFSCTILVGQNQVEKR